MVAGFGRRRCGARQEEPHDHDVGAAVRHRQFMGAASQEIWRRRSVNGITHLGLQLWVPSADGGLERSSHYGAISDASIKQFVRWGHSKGIKVMLTVYNGDNGWDWNLATNAFDTNKAKFVKALVAEMKHMGLDGIDVDLEGPGVDAADHQTAYINFIKALRKALRADGKVLTVDSFHYIWNAPNQTWWPQLFPLVDGITSMGYDDLGVHGTGYQAYDFQKMTAGRWVHKLMIGTPSYSANWLGDDAQTQVNWFLHAGTVGMGIWDAQMGVQVGVTAWQTPGIWKVLKKIRAQ
jgi:GH18 family chitinase